VSKITTERHRIVQDYGQFSIEIAGLGAYSIGSWTPLQSPNHASRVAPWDEHRNKKRPRDAVLAT